MDSLALVNGLALCAMLCGCATGKGIPTYRPAPQADVGKPRPPEQRYLEFDLESSQRPFPVHLDREDVVRLLAVGHPELTYDAVVQVDGKVTLPLIGEIPAAGRTTAELRAEVVRALAGRAGPSAPLRLEYGDVVRLSVWRYPELSHAATVQPDGRIVLPLVGEIVARGRTVAEIQAEVRVKLSSYVRDPAVSILPDQIRRVTLEESQVSVLPVRMRPRQVVVLGEVGAPGAVPIQGDARVMEAISASRYTPDAELDDILIIRTPVGKAPQYRRLKLAAFLRGADTDQNLYLMDRDILFVPKTTIAEIDSFIDRFFARTRPLFDWWYGANAAFYANEMFRRTIDVNKELLRELRR